MSVHFPAGTVVQIEGKRYMLEKETWMLMLERRNPERPRFDDTIERDWTSFSKVSLWPTQK